MWDHQRTGEAQAALAGDDKVPVSPRGALKVDGEDREGEGYITSSSPKVPLVLHGDSGRCC